MMYYVVYIFDMAGMTGNIGLTSSGVQYAVFIIGTFVSRVGTLIVAALTIS